MNPNNYLLRTHLCCIEPVYKIIRVKYLLYLTCFQFYNSYFFLKGTTHLPLLIVSLCMTISYCLRPYKGIQCLTLLTVRCLFMNVQSDIPHNRWTTTLIKRYAAICSFNSLESR